MKTVHIESLPGRLYTIEAHNGRHEWLADEAVADGGDDAGPSPYELLLAALGACMAITLRMYAERKQWPLASVAIELTHERITAEECRDCTPEEIAAAGPGGRIDIIQSAIQVSGELDAEQVARLHEIANRCPVHRTLEAKPKFVSSISASM
jgi:putative redox protein